MNAEELLYSKTHEWAHVTERDGEKIATIGISAFAIEQLTDLVYMELPQTGQAVTAGESMGEVESVKAVSDLYSPVTGEVIDVNTSLVDSLETLGKDPYDAGWIAKIRLVDGGSIDELMDFEAYQKQCSEDG